MLKKKVTKFSKCLDRDMNMIVYGKSTGVPFLGFPTQNSMCRNYEDFGLIKEIAPLIDCGKIQLFTVDSVDIDSWSNKDGDGAKGRLFRKPTSTT